MGASMASLVKASARRRLNMRVVDVDAISHSHEAIVDYVVGHPFDSIEDVAKAIGYSSNQVGLAFKSDSFKARVRERRAELLDLELISDIEGRLKELASVSMWVIKNDLVKNRDVDVALKSLETSTNALGYGSRFSVSNRVVQNNYVVALPEKVSSEGEWVERHGVGVAHKSRGVVSLANGLVEDVQDSKVLVEQTKEN
jgi:hypothetical protein